MTLLDRLEAGEFEPTLGICFAAGTPVLTDTGDAGAGGGSGAADSGSSGESAALGNEDSIESGAEADGLDLGAEESIEEQPERPLQQKEEPEIQEFAGQASSRIRALVKNAPELASVLQKYPQLKNEIEARFRRDFAYREVFPTIAEARQMREHFPNGLSDVQELRNQEAELQKIDQHFYKRDQEGNYSGHAELLNNMFTDDRSATVALFRTLPREWARLDPQSYNEVMGKIVGATLAERGIPEYIGELIEGAKEAKQDGLATSLTKLLNWAQGYSREKPRPSVEEERLQRERSAFNKEKQTRAQEEGSRFHNSFVAESRKLQTGIIKAHPAVKKLLDSKTLTEQKKSEIVEQVRKSMEQFLSKSPSFMRKLTPAYAGRNLNETLTLQKANWEQQWLLNRMVRTVFSKEVPQLVASNREAIRRRAGTPIVKTPVNSGDRKTVTGPKQVNGRWYREGGKGAPFTTAEVLAGKHLL